MAVLFHQHGEQIVCNHSCDYGKQKLKHKGCKIHFGTSLPLRGAQQIYYSIFLLIVLQ